MCNIILTSLLNKRKKEWQAGWTGLIVKWLFAYYIVFFFLHSFAFGSLISAVDPVATLAIFHALDVDPTLNMLVFGESILNDAVSIVMTK